MLVADARRRPRAPRRARRGAPPRPRRARSSAADARSAARHQLRVGARSASAGASARRARARPARARPARPGGAPRAAPPSARRCRTATGALVRRLASAAPIAPLGAPHLLGSLVGLRGPPRAGRRRRRRERRRLRSPRASRARARLPATCSSPGRGRRRLAQALPASQLLEHALVAARGRLAQLAGGGDEHAARARDRDAAEAVRQPVERLDQPGVRQQRSAQRGRPRLRSASRGRAAARRLAPAAIPARRHAAPAPAGGRCRPPSRRRRAGCSPSRRSSTTPGAQQRAERGSDRQLVARLDADVLGERVACPRAPCRPRAGTGSRRPARRRRVRRLATSGLHGLLGRAARVACLAGGALGGVQLLAPALRSPRRAARRDAPRRPRCSARSPSSSASTPGGALGVELRKRLLELRDPLAGAPLSSAACSPSSERSTSSSSSSSRRRAPRPRRQRWPRSRARSRRSSIRSAAERAANSAAGERLARAAVLGERLLGRLAARGHLGEQPLGLVALGARPRRPGLGVGQIAPRATSTSSRRELEARLERLALEPLVQLGGLGLALQRPQPRARLALHVERAVEVVLACAPA